MPSIICRLCLCEEGEKEIMPIFGNEVEDLAIKITNYISITITEEDPLSTSVCSSCISQIVGWETFYNACHKSNETLLKTVEEQENLNDLSNYLVLKEKNEQRFEDKEIEVYQDEFYESDFLDYEFKTEEVTNNSYKCDICFHEFETLFEYLDHQEVHDGEAVFQCDKCPEVFKSRQNLVEHDLNHKIPCDQCGKLILKKSMKLHHIIHTDRFRCTQCSLQCNSQGALSQHIITVHTKIKNHICETCGKCFSSQTAIRVHMKSHSDERLYPCKLCDYAGRTASALYVHMATHANDMCVCEVCSKSFKSMRNLNDHLRRVHTKVKKHCCTYCDKRFVDKYMLKVHLRCHTGLRPYKCSICDKAFIRSDGLKEHMGTHGQRTLYDCKSCGKKFTSKRGLTRHNCTGLL